MYTCEKEPVNEAVIHLLVPLLQVSVNSEFTVNWSVPRASKQDRIGTCCQLV